MLMEPFLVEVAIGYLEADEVKFASWSGVGSCESEGCRKASYWRWEMMLTLF